MTVRSRSSFVAIYAVTVTAVLTVLIAFNRPATAAETVEMTYGPHSALAGGPGAPNPATAAFSVEHEWVGARLTPKRVIGESDFAWLALELPWNNATVTSVEVCYSVQSSQPGRTYISQTRISNTTTPTSSFVRLDDATDRMSTTATCYTVNTGFQPQGTLDLSLKVVFGSTSDRIKIGMVKLTGQRS